MPRHYQIKTASRRYRKWLVDDLPVVVNGRVRGPYDVASITPKAVGSGRFRIGGNRAGVYGMPGRHRSGRRKQEQFREFLGIQHALIGRHTQFSVRMRVLKPKPVKHTEEL